MQSKANAMVHEPCGLLGYAQIAVALEADPRYDAAEQDLRAAMSFAAIPQRDAPS